MPSLFQRILIGQRLPTWAKEHERLTKVKALAVLSSDALSSVAYATEEILLVLVLAGSGALAFTWPIGLLIAGLIVIVAGSYYQTIQGYPSGAGAYIVTHENLGRWYGLVAAASLLVDYILTVSVSISAGTVALTSAFPELIPYQADIGVFFVILITIANLRGVKESGTIFSIPTYAFILLMFGLIGVGFYRLETGSLQPLPMPQFDPTQITHGITYFLILRAFASGCTALTGIEAISDGVPAFEKPEANNACKTLIAMATLLCTMFLGITYLAHALHVVPVHDQSVVSQLGRLVFGDNSMYLILQASTVLILILAANTAFADFPRLASILARDGYLPRQMANLGDRLVYSNGVVALAFLSSLLILIFNGSPHRLIPLYAIGVFMSFTLSQSGMVKRWFKLRTKGWQIKAAFNAVGAFATGVVSVIIISTKFAHGAWIIAILIPALCYLLYITKLHYIDTAKQIALTRFQASQLAQFNPQIQYKVVIPVSRLNVATLSALQFARSLSNDVTAVMINIHSGPTEDVEKEWEQIVKDVPLVLLESPYRSVVEPMLEFLEKTDNREPEKGLAVVVLPEILPAQLWQNLLHNQTSLLLKAALLYKDPHPGKERIVINVPYRLAAG